MAQYQYRSICRGKHSVFEQLKKANIPVDDYIGFYSLRNWGKVKTPDVTIRKESNGSSIIKDSIIQSPQLPHQKRNIINKRRAINKARTINQSKSLEDFAALPMSQQVQLIQQEEELLEQQNMYNDGRLDYVTEQVYIHSKLMIVDDKTVICGSGRFFF